MPFPKYKDIEVPLLQELAERGGQATARDVIDGLIKRFRELTPADLQQETAWAIKTGAKETKWANMVWWARLYLKAKRELESPGRGIWRITDKGRERLASLVAEGTTSPHTQYYGVYAPVPPPPPPPLSVQGPKTAVPPQTLATKSQHEQLVAKLVEMGKRVGKIAKDTSHDPDFNRIDVTWVMTHVFEVHDSGSPHSALSKLQGALHRFSAVKPFLVLVNKEDRQLALNLIQHQFPPLQGRVRMISGESIEAICTALESDSEAIKDLFN